MEIRKGKKGRRSAGKKKKMLTQQVTLEALKIQWVFKTFSDV